MQNHPTLRTQSSFHPSDLIGAIKEVNHVNVLLAPPIAKHLLSEYREIMEGGKLTRNRTGMTQCETEVLQLIVEGNANKKIEEVFPALGVNYFFILLADYYPR